jgi:hypothetical protein
MPPPRFERGEVTAMGLTIYVAETHRSYGVGTTEAHAIMRMAEYWHGGDPSGPTTMMIASCKGYDGGGLFDVDCDKLLSREMLSVPADAMIELLDYVESRDDALMAERVLTASEELDG